MSKDVGFDPDKPVGEQYIEVRSHLLDTVTYYCSLCELLVDEKTRPFHGKGLKHRRQYETVKNKETPEDRLVMEKLDQLCPIESEYTAVEDMVCACECALKMVSDHILQTESSSDSDPPTRGIQGVMRVGLLANGLLMKGETDAWLVLVCVNKPTKELLHKVAEGMPKCLASLSQGKYNVKIQVEEACFIVSTPPDAPMSVTCKISLTSPVMRDHPFLYYRAKAPIDPPGMLNKQRCLEALCAVRRARWYEVKVYPSPYCRVVLPILRDLCKRVATWSPLSVWVLQVLVHKVLSGVESGLSAGRAVQRVFECLASGLLLSGPGQASPGLYDPCEREPTDMCLSISIQDREDITASAQHALRLIAFQQLHKILLLPEPDYKSHKASKTKEESRTASTS